MQADLIYYILNTVIAVVVSLISLRFLLQLTQANYYNSISKGVNRFTAPLIMPFQNLPVFGSFNTGVLLSALLIQAIGSGLCMSLDGGIPSVTQLIIWSLLSVFGVMVNLVFYALLGMIILSWLSPSASNPGAELVIQLSEPFLAPFRRLVPNLGGLDLSPILLFIVINIVEGMVINGTARSMGMSYNIARFFVGITG